MAGPQATSGHDVPMSRPWMLVALWVAAGLAALIAGLAAIQTVRTAVGEPVAGANPVPTQPAATPSATAAPSQDPTPAATSPGPEPTAPATATPGATATPRPTATQPSPPPAAATATLSSAGGTVVASCAAGTVRLLAWSPAPGYAVDEVEAGPAAEAEVRFIGGGSRLQVEVTCGATGPEQRVRVSADGDGDDD